MAVPKRAEVRPIHQYRNFHELGNERDPIIGNQDRTLEYKIPKRPIRTTLDFFPADRRRDHRPSGGRLSAHRPGWLRTPDRREGSSDTDTLLMFGLDHLPSGQEPGNGEIDAIREWLSREGTCLPVGPHHDIGATADLRSAR